MRLSPVTPRSSVRVADPPWTDHASVVVIASRAKTVDLGPKFRDPSLFAPRTDSRRFPSWTKYPSSPLGLLHHQSHVVRHPPIHLRSPHPRPPRLSQGVLDRRSLSFFPRQRVRQTARSRQAPRRGECKPLAQDYVSPWAPARRGGGRSGRRGRRLRGRRNGGARGEESFGGLRDR